MPRPPRRHIRIPALTCDILKKIGGMGSAVNHAILKRGGRKMTREQRIVVTGAASGIAAMLGGMWLLYHAIPAPAGMDTPADRIACALRWDALAFVPLFLMVVALGNARFAGPAIDPTRSAEDKAMIVNARVADNTTQQTLIFVVASLGLAASLPAERMQAIAAAAIWFVIARTAFWIGYRIDPLYRAFGFASTAYLNLGLLGAALWYGFA
jgi:hypothetical protein